MRVMSPAECDGEKRLHQPVYEYTHTRSLRVRKRRKKKENYYWI